MSKDQLRTGRRWRRDTLGGSAALIAAATLAIALTGCGSQTATSGPGGSSPDATAPGHASSSPAVPSDAKLLTTAQQGTRSEVPWTDVGAGWLLATWSPPAPAKSLVKTASGATVSKQPLPLTLFLVDPAGGRYSIATFPPELTGSLEQENLVGWSGDGQRALLDNGESKVTVLDLRTGTASSFTSGPGVRLLGFTAPDGLALLADANDDSTRPHLERLSLAGSLEQAYPSSFGAGGSYTGNPVYSAGGTELAVGATSGIELLANAGQAVRSLPVSSSARYCSPLSWWSSGELLARCTPPGSGVEQLWLVPVSGARATALTASPAAQGDAGDLNAWRLPTGTYVQDAGGCGYQYLARLGSTGRTSPVAVPGVPSGESQLVLGAYGGKLAIEAVGACSGGPSLLWFSPAGNTVVPLLGGSANGGSASGLLFGQADTGGVG